MTAPATETTKMVAPQPEKKVKLHILRDISDPRSTEKMNPPMLMAGSIVELPLKLAKEVLSRKYPGKYEFSGQRESIEKLGVVRVAEIYRAPQPKAKTIEEELEQA